MSRSFRASLLAVALAMSFLPLAAGDVVVVNDVVTGTDASLYVGQQGNGSVYIAATNSPTGDTNGCDVGGVANPVTVYLNASDAAKVTLAVATVTITSGCGPLNATTFGYSVVGGSVGDKVTISAQATGGRSAAGGTPKYVNDVFNVTIVAAPAAPASTDATPPVIAYTLSPAAPDGSNGWYRSDVTIDWTVWENESSISASSGCADETISADTTGLTRTCEATSAGGTGNLTTAGIKRDATKPLVALVGGLADGQSYAAGAVPAAPTCSASDATSGLGTPECAVEGYATTLGNHTVYANATDNAGNTNSTSATYAVIDVTPPEIAFSLSPASPDGSNGWYRSDVAIDWTVWENESSITNATGCADETISTDTAGIARTCQATSAGGTGNATTPTIKLDKTPPSVSLVGGPAEGASYVWGSVPAAPTCDATDATSGVNASGCVVQGYSTAVGAHTIYGNATDHAGNSNSTSISYIVTAWTALGFYAPANDALNTVKAGATVPLKFELFAGSTEITNTTGLQFKAARVSCISAAEDAIENFTTTGSTVLRYDATAGQFVQNWQTPRAGAGQCYAATLGGAGIDPGHPLVALFRLK